MNVGRVFREEGERREAAQVLATQSAPRAWGAMLAAWWDLVVSIASIVGPAPNDLRGPRETTGPLCLLVWRWMWTLPPCSEARKAAFTLGAAALWIERWRNTTDVTADDDRGPCGARPEPSGQRAESLLRIAAWHIDDARGEAHGRTLGIEPSVPPHERVYGAGQPLEPDHGGINFVTLADRDRDDVARRILEDHKVSTFVGGQILKYRGDERAFVATFTELCIASLPDGPWVMTSRDVERFLELILEGGAR